MTGFEVYEADDGWRWRFTGRNGEIMAHGEAYTRREDAFRAVDRLMQLIRSDLAPE